MIPIQRSFLTIIIISMIALNNAQAPVGCSCVAAVCSNIQTSLDSVGFLMRSLTTTYLQIMSYAYRYPQEVPALQAAFNAARQTILNLVSSLKVYIDNCKSDTCCDYCCQSKYGELDNIYNATILDGPNVSIGRAKPIQC